VLVDVQRDFLDPTTAPGVGSWEKAFCVPGIKRLLDHARSQGWRVVHVGTKHQGADTLPDHHRRRGISVYCEEGTPGSDFALEPGEGEIVVFKTWYSAFASDLDLHLRDVSTVIWAGVATDCCIQQSAFDADRRGLHSIIPVQAVSASTSDAFIASLKALAKSAASVVDLRDVAHGDDLPEAGLDLGAIEELAGAWFAERKSQLGDVTGLTLDDALNRLLSGNC
jgi:nicotinamidase-related amidase